MRTNLFSSLSLSVAALHFFSPLITAVFISLLPHSFTPPSNISSFLSPDLSHHVLSCFAFAFFSSPPFFAPQFPPHHVLHHQSMSPRLSSTSAAPQSYLLNKCWLMTYRLMNNSLKRSWGKAGGRQIEGWGDEQRERERARRGRQHGKRNDSEERGVFEGIT